MGPARTPAPKIALPKTAILFHYAADDEVVFEFADERSAINELTRVRKQMEQVRFGSIFIGRCRGPNGVCEYYVSRPRYFCSSVVRKHI